MNVWDQIACKITDLRYYQVCVNIAGRLGIADDLHQEVMLTLCEKIHSQSPTLADAFQKKYIDWYVISTARNLFQYNSAFRRKYRYDITGAVFFTGEDSTDLDIENDESIHTREMNGKHFEIADDDVTFQMVDMEHLYEICVDEFGKIDWYNYELFRLHSMEGLSVRAIEKQTGIPKTSVHQSIMSTREALAKRVKETIKPYL